MRSDEIIKMILVYAAYYLRIDSGNVKEIFVEQ